MTTEKFTPEWMKKYGGSIEGRIEQQRRLDEQRRAEQQAVAEQVEALAPDELAQLSPQARQILQNVAKGSWTVETAEEYAAFQAGEIGFRPGEIGYGGQASQLPWLREIVAPRQPVPDEATALADLNDPLVTMDEWNRKYGQYYEVDEETIEQKEQMTAQFQAVQALPPEQRAEYEGQLISQKLSDLRSPEQMASLRGQPITVILNLLRLASEDYSKGIDYLGEATPEERAGVEGAIVQAQLEYMRNVEALVAKGRSPEAIDALRSLGMDDTEINGLFVSQELRDMRQQEFVTSFTELFPKLKKDDEYIDQVMRTPNLMGLYLETVRGMGLNPQTIAFLNSVGIRDHRSFIMQPGYISGGITWEKDYIPENMFKDAWDALSLEAARIGKSSLEYMFSTLPRQIFKDYPEDTPVISQNKKNARDKFRQVSVYVNSQFEDWVEKKPELRPKPAFEKPFDINRMKEPDYLLYQLGKNAAFSGGLLAATLGVGFLTKNPYAAMGTAWALATPSQAQDVYEDLLASGATKDQAAQWSIPVGLAIGGLDAVGEYPLLAALSPVFNTLRRKAQQEIIKRTALSAIKKGITTFGTVEATELITENMSNAIQNAFASMYDENRNVFDNAFETTMITALVTAPYAFIGGGSTMLRIGQNEAAAMSPEERKSLTRDEKTGEWFAPVDIKALYDQTVAKAQKAGLSKDQAVLQGLNQVAMTEEGASNITAEVLSRLQGITPLSVQAVQAGRLELQPEKPEVTPAPEVTITKEEAMKFANPEKPYIVEEIYDKGLTVNTDGTMTLYHATTKERAEQLIKNKTFKTAEGAPDAYGVYFSTSPEVAESYGDGTLVKVRVKLRDLNLDDSFPGRPRMDFQVNTKGGIFTPVSLEPLTPTTPAPEVTEKIDLSYEVYVEANPQAFSPERVRLATQRLQETTPEVINAIAKVRQRVIDDIETMNKELDFGASQAERAKRLTEIQSSERIKQYMVEILGDDPTIRLYRGVGAKWAEREGKGLGQFWTSKRDVAEQYARGQDVFQLDVKASEIANRKLGEVVGGREAEYRLTEELTKRATMVTPPAPAVAQEPLTETTPTGEEIPSTITEAPAPTEGATARVFSRIQTEYAEPGFVQKVKQGWHKFNIKMVDDLDPIRRITEELKKGGVELSIDENPYLLARLLRGVTSKATTFLEFGTFGKNFWKMEKGRAVPNYTGESLQNILNEVKDPVVWRDFSTYLTARRAAQLSERDIETGIVVEDARASIAELEGKYANFSELAQRVYKYQDNLLVYAREMGLLSKEILEKLRKFGDYVPFYRVMNELQAKGLFGKKMANVANPIKRIKGSEREIINPLESIVKNTYVLVSAADRNQVGIAIANLVDKNPDLADIFERVRTPMARVAQVSAKELGVDIEGMTEAEEEQLVDIFRPSFFVRGDEVTVLIDGKKNYYRVDPDLRDSLLRLDRESLGLLGRWLGAPARWLRAGATLSPDFMFRNPARDQLSAFAYSNYGFIPGIDFIKGIASMLHKGNDYQLFRMSGAEHSMIVSMDRSYLRKTFKQLVGEEGFTEYVKHPLELFRIISELGEKATRLGEFRKGIQQGAVPLEAGYSARSVTLDFAQAGTTAQAINTFIAFFNANIRGWGKMLSSFKEHPVRTSAKVFMGITLPSILLWMVNHDDERWKEIPQWQKDLFWIVFIDDNIYRIPKPFELGIIFGSFPERFLDFLVEKDPDLMKELAQALMEAGSPGFIPTAGLPILEWMTNYSFFRGRAIVPESRKDMPPELQYTRWSSEVSKKLSELLKLPPAQIDNFLFAWTGGLGRYATDIIDGILKGTGVSPDIPEPSPTLADMPVIKAFVVRSPVGSSSEAVNDFYNLLEEYEGGEKYLKEMLINGELEKYNKFKAAHPELFFFADFNSERYIEAIAKGETPKDVFYSSSARYLRRVAGQLSEIRKKEDLIYKDPDMSSEKKRELIDELEILKTDIARRAMDLLEMKDPTILQDMINETVNRLGEIIEEETPLSLEEPDIHDMGKLNQDFKSILEGATVEELQKLKGVNPLAVAWVEKEGIEKIIEPIISRRIKDIDFNLRKEVSFEDYYRDWRTGLVKDSPLDKLSKRQIVLLRDYQASEDRQAYLKSLSDEDRDALNLNPQDEWLKSHPKENAQLAVWGQVKILTKEAYNEFKRLVDELDIPDNAIPPMLGEKSPFFQLPEQSVDNYLAYQNMENKNSWEAQLMLAKDPDLLEFLERQPIDTPIASLELKVKNRDLFDKLDAFSDRDSPDYIADEKARAEAIKKFRTDNPEFVDDTRRIEAIEKGTDENPIDEKLVSAHVEYGKLIDEEGIGSSSAEAMLYRVDNPDYDKWRQDTDIWGDQALTPIDQSRIPIWRIDVKYATEDAEYNAIKNLLPSEQARLRAEYMDTHEAYRKDNRRREAYGLTNSKTGYKFPTTEVENYVAYNELSIKGKRRDRFLVDNSEFANALYDVGQIVDLPDPAKVPAVQFDDIYDQFSGQFDEIEKNGQPESEWFEPDPIKRAARDNELRFDPTGKYTEFGLAEIRRNAYGLFVPENYVNDYVGYYTIIGQGKPADADYWYEDDWYLLEHPSFYKQVYLGVLGNQKRNFGRVPTRKVYQSLLTYNDLSATGKDRLIYRHDNQDLENYLVNVLGYTPVGDRWMIKISPPSQPKIPQPPQPPKEKAGKAVAPSPTIPEDLRKQIEELERRRAGVG